MSVPHHIVQERARRIIRLLMQGKLQKQIVSETGCSFSHVQNIRNRYIRETVTLRLNAEGKRLMAEDQMAFPFLKPKRTLSVQAKILRSLGRKNGV